MVIPDLATLFVFVCIAVAVVVLLDMISGGGETKPPVKTENIEDVPIVLSEEARLEKIRKSRSDDVASNETYESRLKKKEENEREKRRNSNDEVVVRCGTRNFEHEVLNRFMIIFLETFSDRCIWPSDMRAMTEILRFLDCNGDVPSVVDMDDDPDTKKRKNGSFSLLKNVSLIEHSVNCALEYMKEDSRTYR